VGKNPHAVALGRKGGKKGGKARAANLTPEQLSEIGRKGAEARWRKKAKEGQTVP
jgi:general stress protein YciG